MCGPHFNTNQFHACTSGGANVHHAIPTTNIHHRNHQKPEAWPPTNSLPLVGWSVPPPISTGLGIGGLADFCRSAWPMVRPWSPTTDFRFTFGKVKCRSGFCFWSTVSAVGAVWHGAILMKKNIWLDHRPKKESACKSAAILVSTGGTWFKKSALQKPIFPTSSNWTPGWQLGLSSVRIVASSLSLCGKLSPYVGNWVYIFLTWKW